jgi:hypothetical protein
VAIDSLSYVDNAGLKRNVAQKRNIFDGLFGIFGHSREDELEYRVRELEREEVRTLSSLYTTKRNQWPVL